MNIKQMARICKFVLLGAALAYIAVFITVAVLRMRYPFELEWMEGASLQQVARILAGQRLYVTPSLEYVPMVYPPLYFYVSAGLASVLGTGFLPLRLVSFLTSLGSLGVIFLFVRSETKDWFVAALASGLFAATFDLSGSWFDIARVDSLFLFLLLAAFYLLRFGTSAKSHVLAGMLLALSFLTKQTALAAVVPMAIYALAVNRRHGFIFVGVTLTVIGVSMLILNYVYSGWYRFYTVDLPSQHSILKDAIGIFWNKGLIEPLPVACSFSIFYFAVQGRSDLMRTFFYLLTAAGLLGLSWIATLNNGNYTNVLLPAYAILAILFGLGVHHSLTFWGPLAGENYHRMEILVFLLSLSQLLALVYNPLQELPRQADWQAGQAIVGRLKQTPGDVFIPAHGYLATLAGKRNSAHEVSIDELRGVFGGELTRPGAVLMDDLRESLREQKYSLVILDGPWPVNEIEDYYMQQGSVVDSPDVFWPITGYKTRPELVYVPRQQ